MNTTIDLRQLAVQREATRGPPRRPRRHLASRYVLPGVILLGFLGVLGWAARDSLLPAKPVTVVPVLATRAEVQQSGTTLFQSAGWVEPRPTPVVVSALAEGVVDKLLVVEGQEVHVGQTVAHLIDTDARLALAAAEAEVNLRQAELSVSRAALRSAEAREQLAQFVLESRGQAFKAKAVPEIEYRQAETDLKAATAVREETEANTQVAEARLRQARVSVDIAQLRLERMTIKAPAAGRVLALVARPGTKLMGLALGSAQESSTVITLYDPEKLQVRADVRLDDVPRLQTGQPVRIETPAVPGGPLDGEMLFATAITDIQKNTLQVKVAIKSPPPMLKPDMLVQVTFLAPEQPAGSAASAEQLRLFVPRQLVESGEGGARIWIADSTAGLARLKAIKLGQGALGDLVEVVEGLTPADKVIAGGREGLTDGLRITVTGDELGAGVSAHEHKSEPRRLPTAPKEGAGPKRKK
jgi:RND family efflux transporter MFP subunit